MVTPEKQSKTGKKKTDNGASSGQSNEQPDVAATATEAVGQVQDTVVGLKDSVTTQVKEQASTQLMARLESVTGTLDMATKLLRTAGDTVRDQEKTGVADTITGVADRLETWSSSIREQDVDKLVDETKQLAQKQPVLFVAGAATLGFLGARFFSTSAKKQEEQAAKEEEKQAATARQEQAETASSFSSSPSPSEVARSMSSAPVTDMPDLPAASTTTTTDFDYTDAYPSVEENAAIEASMEAPFGAEETMVFEDEIVVPDFDDRTKGSKPGTGQR